MSMDRKQFLIGAGGFLAGALVAAGFLLVRDFGILESGPAMLERGFERRPQLKTISGRVSYQPPEVLLVESTGRRSLLVWDFEDGQRFRDQISIAYNRIHSKLGEGEPLTVTGWRHHFGARPIIIVQSIDDSQPPGESSPI